MQTRLDRRIDMAYFIKDKNKDETRNDVSLPIGMQKEFTVTVHLLKFTGDVSAITTIPTGNIISVTARA